MNEDALQEGFSCMYRQWNPRGGSDPGPMLPGALLVFASEVMWESGTSGERYSLELERITFYGKTEPDAKHHVLPSMMLVDVEGTSHVFNFTGHAHALDIPEKLIQKILSILPLRNFCENDGPDPVAVRRRIRMLHSTPVARWSMVLDRDEPNRDLKFAALCYQTFMHAYWYDGKYLDSLTDNVGFATSGEHFAKILKENLEQPIIIPPGVPTKLYLVLSTTPRGQVHAGLVLQMDEEHDNYERVAAVLEALPTEIDHPAMHPQAVHPQAVPRLTLKPCILVHRVDDGCLVVQGQSLDELSAHVSGVYTDSLPPISIDITDTRPLTDSWVKSLFEHVRVDNTKTMNPNASDLATETNCTLFVMQALRLLGGGGVVDLSFEAVYGHLIGMGIPDDDARDAAERWIALWGMFLATPKLRVDGGFKEELKPVLRMVMMRLKMMQAGVGDVATPPPNRRKRKHAQAA